MYHIGLGQYFLTGKSVTMATNYITLATVGVVSAILGILFQNGSLVKLWNVYQEMKRAQFSQSIAAACLKNGSYQFDFQKALKRRKENMQNYNFDYNVKGVDRHSRLSLEEFRDVYDSKWPVIITDVVPRWTAFDWTPEYFTQNYGEDRVVMRAVHGSLKESSGLSLPLSMFLQNINKSSPDMWTYVEDELFISVRPKLKEQIGKYKYLDEDFFRLLPESLVPWNSMILWGTAYSRSSLHIDPYNWTGTNAVLSGNKRWKLFPPGQDQLLYVVKDSRCGFPLDCWKYNSEVDAFDFNAEKYPLFERAEFIEFDQKPGELLIIPTGWFHQAYNTEVTLAVSSQVMNTQNYLVVLEEIIKAGNIKRSDLPSDFADRSPKQQVESAVALLSPEIIAQGKKVTEKVLKDVARRGK